MMKGESGTNGTSVRLWSPLQKIVDQTYVLRYRINCVIEAASPITTPSSRLAAILLFNFPDSPTFYKTIFGPLPVI